MKLAEATWPEVSAFLLNSDDKVALVPTGSLEQHGPHLPLFTDTLIATAVAEGIEKALPDQVLLTPTLWLGASGHHMEFAGTLNASFPAYHGALESVVGSLLHHGFRMIYVINGHGGNTAPNQVALRSLREKHPECQMGEAGWFEFVPSIMWAEVLEGPLKTIKHACEAETSVMLHLHPHLVRTDLVGADGLTSSPPVPGMVWRFDEMTEMGSWGHSKFGTAEKGRVLFEAAVSGGVSAMRALSEGIVLLGPEG